LGENAIERLSAAKRKVERLGTGELKIAIKSKGKIIVEGASKVTGEVKGEVDGSSARIG
jgi:hypothetical protein